MSCSVEDCQKKVFRGGLCRGHYERKRTGRRVHGQLRQWGDPKRTFMEAAFAFNDASESDEAEYFRAWNRLCAAGRRLFRTK